MVLFYHDNSLGNSGFSSWKINISQNINTFAVVHIEHVEITQVVEIYPLNQIDFTHKHMEMQGCILSTVATDQYPQCWQNIHCIGVVS